MVISHWVYCRILRWWTLLFVKQAMLISSQPFNPTIKGVSRYNIYYAVDYCKAKGFARIVEHFGPKIGEFHEKKRKSRGKWVFFRSKWQEPRFVPSTVEPNQSAVSLQVSHHSEYVSIIILECSKIAESVERDVPLIARLLLWDDYLQNQCLPPK